MYERFEADGFWALRNFWQHGELDTLETQLRELGRRIVGPRFSVHDLSRYQLEPAIQSPLYDKLK